ncbi:streptomycin 6-kinase [Stackebrandtia albiflava]|uniref:Streptomycin 6-kinase n=1 Tax=Stackebrandtia albiflava TaxID=406432 RepID=A0A562VGZ5_9ACTN|nr:aminoglycoside phosphotransferase family protein [Stackebrandtia albiflava]TWJ17138.1 streptomycin 6-kinase [Stackebrandtia albiflava]
MSLVPAEVARIVRRIFAERGHAWLDDLPRLVEDRCREWRLEVTGPAFTGGTHSYVAPVNRADGTAAVLKVPVVDEWNVAEPTALYHYGGEGAVLLYEYDADSGAMLLERADPGEPLVSQEHVATAHREGLPEHAGDVEFAARLYRRLWRVPGPAPADLPPIPTVVDQAADWAELFAGYRGDDIPAPMLREAERLCRVLTVPDGPVGVANMDNHLGNIVSARREPWLLIDPKPKLGERAFDAGYLLRIQLETTPTEVSAVEYTIRTAEWLEVDPRRAHAWAFVRSMEDLYWGLDEDDADFVRNMSAVAEVLFATADRIPGKPVV